VAADLAAAAVAAVDVVASAAVTASAAAAELTAVSAEFVSDAVAASGGNTSGAIPAAAGAEFVAAVVAVGRGACSVNGGVGAAESTPSGAVAPGAFGFCDVVPLPVCTAAGPPVAATAVVAETVVGTVVTGGAAGPLGRGVATWAFVGGEAGGNADGGGLPPAGDGLPPWLPWPERLATLLRGGLLLCACRVLEKSWPPTAFALESESELGLNWDASLLG
jgi:hypothetical protein